MENEHENLEDPNTLDWLGEWNERCQAIFPSQGWPIYSITQTVSCVAEK